jgi:hypothetical protein
MKIIDQCDLLMIQDLYFKHEYSSQNTAAVFKIQIWNKMFLFGKFDIEGHSP